MIGLGLGICFQAGAVSQIEMLRAALFSGSGGALLDLTDIAQLWQDAAGSTPAAAPGQPVAFVTDTNGGPPGADLRSTGTVVTTGSPGTLATYNPATGAGSAYRLDASNISGVRIVVPDGKYYIVDVEALTGNLQIRGSGLSGTDLAGSIASRRTVRVFAGSGEDLHFVSGTNAAGTNFIIHSIRELPGNHARQTIAAARPAYQLDSNGRGHLSFDAVDDALTVMVPAGGWGNATVAYATDAGVTILTGQTIAAGAWTLPIPRPSRCYAVVAVNRALTANETTLLTSWLNSERGVTA